MARKKQPKSVYNLGDEKLYERLKDAAEAGGFDDVSEMMDAVVDSGFIAAPEDPAGGKFTLEDLGMRMWTICQGKGKAARTEWYAQLAPAQRKALLTVLRTNGMSHATIAREFGLREADVYRDWQRYAAQLGDQVVGLRLESIAGQVEIFADKLRERAMNEGNLPLAWRIEERRLKMLQDLGVVDRAVHKTEHHHKMDDDMRIELQQLLELERKRLTRSEELKTIEFEVLGTAPQEDEKTEELHENPADDSGAHDRAAGGPRTR